MKILVTLFLLMCLSANAYDTNTPEFKAKVDMYYEKFKISWGNLSGEFKDNIIIAYLRGKNMNIGYSLAGIRFLENRGRPTETYYKTIGINQGENINTMSFDCGAYGINTRTYLKTKGNYNPNIGQQMEACIELSKNPNLAFVHGVKVLSYALNRYNGNFVRAWNYYNTGRDVIIGDRIYQMTAIIKVLKEEDLDKYYTIILGNKFFLKEK